MRSSDIVRVWIMAMVIITLLSANNNIKGQGSWREHPPIPAYLLPRAVSFSVNGKGYVAGGQQRFSEPFCYSKTVYRFDPETDEWDTVAPLPFELSGAVSFSIEDTVYIITGRDSLGLRDEILRFDPSTETCTITGTIPEPCRRYGGTGFSIGAKGYIAMGIETDLKLSTSDIWEFDPSTYHWVERSPCPSFSRYDLVSFVIENKAYLGTGRDVYGSLNDFWEYDPTTDTWAEKASIPDSARDASVGFSLAGKGYLTWGWSNFWTNFNQALVYNSVTDVWQEIQAIPEWPRTHGTSFIIDNTAYLTAGYFYGFPLTTWAFTPFPVGVEDPGSSAISCFPNPTDGSFELCIPECDRHLSIQIVDLQGKMRLSLVVSPKQKIIELDISHLPGGFYFLTVSDGQDVLKNIKLLKR